MTTVATHPVIVRGLVERGARPDRPSISNHSRFDVLCDLSYKKAYVGHSVGLCEGKNTTVALRLWCTVHFRVECTNTPGKRTYEAHTLLTTRVYTHTHLTHTLRISEASHTQPMEGIEDRID